MEELHELKAAATKLNTFESADTETLLGDIYAWEVKGVDKNNHKFWHFAARQQTYSLGAVIDYMSDKFGNAGVCPLTDGATYTAFFSDIYFIEYTYHKNADRWTVTTNAPIAIAA